MSAVIMSSDAVFLEAEAAFEAAHGLEKFQVDRAARGEYSLSFAELPFMAQISVLNSLREQANARRGVEETTKELFMQVSETALFKIIHNGCPIDFDWSERSLRFAAVVESAPVVEEGSREWAWAQKLYDFHGMNHAVENGAAADVILVLCSHDIRVADHAAALILKGVGKWLLFTGGFGTGPHSGANLNGWTKPEAEIFANRAIELGVPAGAILVELLATNTGENIRNSRALLEARGLPHADVVVVQKPFMERRSYATLMRQWGNPLPKIRVTSPPISFAAYPNDHISRSTLVSIMVGDLQRLYVYATPERDFQIPQDIPGDIWAAYEGLRDAGYDGNVIL